MEWIAASRMGRRIGAVLCLCAVIPVLAFAFAAARQSLSTTRQNTALRLQSVSNIYAMELMARLGAAETIVQAMTAHDVGEGAALKQQVINSRAFKSVVIVDRNGLATNGRAALRPSSAQMMALEAGQTVLTPVALQGQLPATFLARAVSSSGAQRLAYFELAPDWLWKDLYLRRSDVQIVVVDAEARMLQSAATIPPQMLRMFARHIDLAGERVGESRPLKWQSADDEWRGALTHLPLVNERITAAPWAVVAFKREPAFWTSGPVWSSLPWALLLALLCAVTGSLFLIARHLPPLRDLRRGFIALQTRQIERITARGSDEPRSLVEAFNRSAVSIQDQFRALETLAEIDQLLLGSVDLEQVLDAILSRVQAVTQCHSAGITLLDGDAPGRGRVYVTTSGLMDLPVSRVALDEHMVATLANEAQGLTIARSEDARHSFLRPQKEMGAEIFWVWPVLVADNLEAILSVGYRETPISDPQIARCGGQFAARLATALSKNARDERLYRQAHYDPLTALPNRLLFRERLSQELANAASGLTRGALLYIDLDHFKKVNDSVGHSAGDQLLTIVAQRLRACVKEGDMVARLGGDEFTVILRNVPHPDAAHSVAQRVVDSLQNPVSLGGSDHHVCASIGITLYPDDGSSIEELVRNADTAMYRAKELGRSRLMFFDRKMAVRHSSPSDSGLHRALRRREFSLFYQPQFSVADGSLAGVEALLRWQSPRDGMRTPLDFVPAAEESGLLVDIGGWVLETACAQLAAWREKGIAPGRLSVNVAAQQLRHVEFPKTVRRALDKHGLPPELLELEVTESVFADEAAGAALVRLAQVGVRLALDDFGTGYSSLSYLRQYPISIVKIDRTFLEEVPHNPASAALVDTVIVMAHALGKRVVAEGIENIEQLDFLRERRCDLAQGFYMARPLTVQSMTELLHARLIVPRDSNDVRAAG